MSAEQLPLDLPHLTSHSRDDFFVSGCNREAVAYIDRWPEWPAHGALLIGPGASGKSHLLSIWSERAGARMLPARDLSDDPGEPAEKLLFAIDDGQDCGNEQALLHLYNWSQEQGGSLLIAASCEPARWGLTLSDLSSRLLTLPLLHIGLPDDPLLGALMAKQFADRQIEVDAGVLRYLTSRMERSFAAANRLVKEMDQAALRHQRRITVPLAREVLAAMDQRGEG